MRCDHDGGTRVRSTKIVCTIGPASESKRQVKQLLEAGMNVARLNFSHGTVEEHGNRIRNIREASKETGIPVGIMLDIQGPKIRIGNIPGGKRTVAEGDTVTFCTDETLVDDDCIFIGYETILQDLSVGSTIFVDDGLIELVVEEIQSDRMMCRVTVGGDIKSRKGVSLPGVNVDLPPLSESDREHIRFGVEQQVDFIAASFVRRAEHVKTVKQLIAECGGNQLVIAKIENSEGVRNIKEIAAKADGIMVARGDMGVEMPPEDVPIAQKRIIAICNRMGKPVITATHMLDSMVYNPRPTRAEVTDVANAIFEGTDAVMLSGETAVGQHPSRVVRIMSRIAQRTESEAQFSNQVDRLRTAVGTSVAEAMALATFDAAEYLQVRAILSITRSGATARRISKYRPKMPILAITPNMQVARQLTLMWGVQSFVIPRTDDVEQMVDSAITAVAKAGFVQSGDEVAIVAGVRAQKPGSTNSLQVQTVVFDGQVAHLKGE